MRNSRKALLTGVAATAAGMGYMAGKKRKEQKSPYNKFMDKLDEILS